MDQIPQFKDDFSQKPVDRFVQRALFSLKKEYVLVGKNRMKLWQISLIAGIIVGILVGILLIANRSY